MAENKYDFTDNRFTAWDYVVFAALLAISSVIGLYYGCTGSKQSSTSEFLMAGRSMGIFPVALSLLASFMSAITLLGTPAEIAVFGTQYWMIWLSYCFVIPLSAYVFVPVFYRLNLTSVFEYLELRFSKGVRVYTSLVYMLQMILYMALVLYAPCLALSVVTGLNKWIAVFSVGVVCTFYTTIGGMKAVMWTDVVQIFMMFAGMIAVIIKGAVDEGFGHIWETMYNDSRVEFLNFDPNPLTRHTIWSLVIGGTFTWLAIYGVNQAQVQRALCTPTCRQGQIAMWINLPGLSLLLTICGLCGMVIYHEYRRCDPIAAGRIQGRDQLLPLYVMDKLHYPGFPGFFTACIFSGALSTISSGLNSLAAVCLQDLLRGLWWKDISEAKATLASKIISVAFGAIMIVLTFMAAELGGLLQAALGIFGMIGGPILGIFILGLIYPWANSKGAYFGMTAGLILTIWLGVGAQIYHPPIRGHVPPPMNTSECPLLSSSYNETNGNETLIYLLDSTATTTAKTVATTAARWAEISSTATDYNNPELVPGYLSFYQMSYMWYSAFAVFVTSISGLLVSFLTGYTRPCDVDPALMCPIFDIFCCCLPASWRRLLRCHQSIYDEKSQTQAAAAADVVVVNGMSNGSSGTKRPTTAANPTKGVGHVNYGASFTAPENGVSATAFTSTRL
jgi:sodium-coupled monocarboxylate transporter 8/12